MENTRESGVVSSLHLINELESTSEDSTNDTVKPSQPAPVKRDIIVTIRLREPQGYKGEREMCDHIYSLWWGIKYLSEFGDGGYRDLFSLAKEISDSASPRRILHWLD